MWFPERFKFYSKILDCSLARFGKGSVRPDPDVNKQGIFFEFDVLDGSAMVKEAKKPIFFLSKDLF